MDQTILFYIAIIVFSLMAMGLALTFWEFSRGAPDRQARAARNPRRDAESLHSAHRP